MAGESIESRIQKLAEELYCGCLFGYASALALTAHREVTLRICSELPSKLAEEMQLAKPVEKLARRWRMQRLLRARKPLLVMLVRLGFRTVTCSVVGRLAVFPHRPMPLPHRLEKKQSPPRLPMNLRRQTGSWTAWPAQSAP